MHTGMIVAVTVLSVIGSAGYAAADELGRAGTFVALQGTVTMQPATLTAPRPVHPYDEIGPLAIIETQPASRAKVLFDDDTLITVGPLSRLEMTEQTYRAGSDSRTFVAHLTRGKARALVGRSFKGDNSIFEVHSRTAVASARGTYFVMWIQEPSTPPTPKDRKGASRIPAADEGGEESEGATGVANIGTSGDITFTSGGATVLVFPGQSSIALPGSPPSMPVPINPQAGPVAMALADTVVSDVPRAETPRTALAAVGMGGATLSASTTALVPAGAGGQFPSGAYAVPGWPLPVTPVTPPAVVSGAAGSSLSFSIKLP